jgi:hypothetical protein
VSNDRAVVNQLKIKWKRLKRQKETRPGDIWVEIRRRTAATASKYPVVYYCRIKLTDLQHTPSPSTADGE